MSQDVSALSQNIPSGGVEGVPGLVQFYQSGTTELKRLLQTECDVIYECRYCRGMFRSIINFTTHKRQYCKGKFGAVVANSSALWEQYLEKVQKNELDEEDGDKTRATNNMVKIVQKASQEVAVPVPGSSEKLILSTLPRTNIRRVEEKRLVGLAASEQDLDQVVAKDDRIIVNFPQDPNTRNKSVRLMGRRSDKDAILNRYSAALPPNELAALHKILHFNPEVIDGLSIKCRHPGCVDVRPFKNFSVFAYHCGMKHSTRGKGHKLSCYLCNHTIKQWSNYFQHYVRVHKNVKEQHEKDRLEDTDTVSPKKSHRVRSLSPNLGAAGGEERDEEENDNGDQSSPPIIQPIEPNDSGMVDCDDNEDEEPPTLVRMGRTRSRNLRNGPIATPARSTRHVSRATPSPFTSLPDEAQELEKQQRKLEEQERKANKKLTQDVKWVMEHLLKQVVEEDGEKIDVSGVRLYGRKRKLRGRAAYKAKCEQVLNQQARQASLPLVDGPVVAEEEIKEEEEEEEIEPEELEEEPTMKKEKLEETPQESPQEAGKEAGPDMGSARPSRAKKRPDWMESYLLEEKKTIKEETPAPQKDSSVPPAPARAVVVSKAKSSPQKPIPKIRIKPIRKPATPTPPPEEDKEDFVFPLTDSATPTEASAEPSPIPSPGSSRRKQDMSLARDATEEALLTFGKHGQTPADLSGIPVYLSPQQKAIIFAGLKPQEAGVSYNASSDHQQPGGYICEHCNARIESLKDARRHMVSHIRVIRLRCKLCNAGSFFLTDLRVHLQEKGCPNLNRATFPIKEAFPCMTRLQADSLCEIVDTTAPGRVRYSSEKIVSVTSKVPYTPDLEIEERILGPDRAKEFLSPSKRHFSSRRAL